MKASVEWLAASGADFSPPMGRTGVAQLRNYNAEYQEWGEGPPLVLVPGLAGGYDLLGPLIRQLAEHFRVISYQLRGEDDCFALRQRFALGDLVQDLAQFIDSQCLERPTVVGVSFGGVIGLEYAARFPARVKSLAVQGVGARFERGLLQRVAGVVLSRYPLPADSAFVNQFFNLLFGARQKPGPLFEFVTRQCWQTDQSVMAHRFRLVERFDIGERLNAIQAPTLVISGRRDLLVSERSLGSLCKGIERCKLVRLKGGGHLASVAQPKLVAEAIRQFAL